MADKYWVGGTGTWNTVLTTNWRTTSGGLVVATVPTAADNVIFDSNSGGTFTVTMTGALACLSFTVSSGTVTFALGTAPTLTVAGDMSLSSGTVWSSTGTTTFTSTTSRTITTSGTSMNCPITFNGAGGTWVLQDALTMNSARLLSHTNGTIDLNGKTLTVGTGYTTVAGTKNLTFNGGTLVCPTASTTSFNNAVPTGFTTTRGVGAPAKISMTAATAKTFVGGGSTYNCTLSNDGAGALTISGSNSIGSIANGVSPTTLTFTISTTQTITSSWDVAGAAGNLITINTTTAGTRATIAKSFTGRAFSDYLSVRDIAFTPAPNNNGTVPYSWALGGNSTNTSNNTGGAFVTQKIVYVIATAGTTSWTVPSDWSNTDNNIQLIGAGGGGGTSSAVTNRRGGGGGGGGGYTSVTNFSTAPNSTVSLVLGTGGAANTAGSATTFASGTYTAGGGGAGTAGTVSPGGNGAGGVGSTYNGGAGGVAYFSGNGAAGGPGGGAAGPRGNGGDGGGNLGGSNQQYVGSGGGGGNGGGSAGAAWPGTAAGGAGGNNADGVGGGASGVSGTLGGGGGGNYSNSTGGTPGSGSAGVDIFKIIGSGGGPGGTPATGGGAGAGVAGALYGAGGGGASLRSTQQGSGTFAGGAGAQGLIVISYYPSDNTANFFLMF
jgi:hypothetical protein